MLRPSVLVLAAALVTASIPTTPAAGSDGEGAAAASVTVTRPLVERQLKSTTDPVPRIVNGLRAGGLYPTVGMLARNGFFLCSATLVGCRTVLTAAHCVFDPLVPAQHTVFLQHAGFLAVSKITRHPDFSFGQRSDLALLELAEPVTGIAPSLLNTEAEPPLGTIGDIVGFGGVGELDGPGTGHYRYGIKRRGDVETAACTLVPESTHICWSFTAPIGDPGTDSNTCNGDSGGPLFADIAGLGVAVAGITSGGNGSCLPEDNAFDADVYLDHEWIESVAGDDLVPVACGASPTVLGPDTQVLFDRAAMATDDGGLVYSFDVPPGMSELRVTTNGELAPAQDYDLYVKAGADLSVDPPDYDCASTNGTTFEACSFHAPAAGPWWILVSNPGGDAGEVDVTVSILGGCSTLDADGDGTIVALTDGLLVLRHLFGLTGSALTASALGAAATRDAGGVAAFLEGCAGVLDVDGDGSAMALTDGLLLLRYLFGFGGAELVAGAVGEECTRCAPEAIVEHLDALVPP